MRIRVGIFYNGDEERKSAEEFIKNQMHSAYSGEEPQRIITSRYGSTYVYGNGDVWCSVRAYDSARGRRFNVVYYSSTIEKEFVDCNIRRCAIRALGICKEIDIHYEYTE